MNVHEVVHRLIEVRRNLFSIRTIVNQPTAVNLIDQSIDHVTTIGDRIAPELMDKHIDPTM